jgi:penicillin-binding protein 2
MYKLRLKILFGLIALAVLGMLARVAQLQLVQGRPWRDEAERRLQSVRLLPAQRGRILDRNGFILAEDEACFDFCMDYRLLFGDEHWERRQVRAICREKGWSPDDPNRRADARKTFDDRVDYTRQLANKLAEEYGGDLVRRIERLGRSVRRMEDRVGRAVREQKMLHPVVTGLGEKAADSIRPLLSETVGAALTPGRRRRYPFGSFACHVIGLTTPVWFEDTTQYNLSADQAPWLDRMRANYLPGDTIGRTGVERMCEPLLRPRRGYQRYRRPGEEVSETVPAQAGRDIRLSIDIKLQAALTDLLARTKFTGSAVVLDVETNEPLALVSWPTFDLNRYAALREQLETDSLHLPMLHRAVAAACAPGSVVKPITALAGLAQNKIRLDEPLVCTGSNPYSPQGQPRCWIYKQYHTTHGALTTTEGLKHSCNIYFLRVAHRLGGPTLTYWFRLFGFDALPGTGLPEEKPGELASDAWLRQNRSEIWFLPIGQGRIAATPLQVANAMAAIARDGEFRSVQLLRGTADDRAEWVRRGIFPEPDLRKLPIAVAHTQAVRDGMYKVVNESGGTAYKSWRDAPGDPGVPVCGKTGTAATPPLRRDSNGNGRIDEDDEILREGDNAWFAGFAPYRRPRIAFAVLVEYAGGGGKNAAPIAKQLVQLCREFGYLGDGE